MHTHLNAEGRSSRDGKLEHILIVGAGRAGVRAALCSNLTMRVIAGEFRSRVLVAPRGTATRPSSDRLRETLFNVIGPRVREARFADFYAGSGAVGIEALSRGATYCLFVEPALPALAAIRRNLGTLGLTDLRATVDPRTSARVLAEGSWALSFDLIFLDPPYEAAAEYSATLTRIAHVHGGLLAPEGLVIAEHARRAPLPERFGDLVRSRLLEQGDAALSFYTVAPLAPGAAEG